GQTWVKRGGRRMREGWGGGELVAFGTWLGQVQTWHGRGVSITLEPRFGRGPNVMEDLGLARATFGSQVRDSKHGMGRARLGGSRRDKPIIEFDPEIAKTLKKNRSRVKAQRTPHFEQEEVNSEEGASENSFEEEFIEEEIQDNMADNANN
ncbi:hypothetical protein PIB30_092983, partial [Stylosanthes scabra]|nr:hypothetical protein [Stylosanthes scabra]